MDKIDTIRAFVAVATEGSFSKAAEKLIFSRAIVSKYVSALEERLGVRLINRTTRSMNLTEAGEIYLKRSIQLLEDLEELDLSVQETAAVVKGGIRISMPRTLGEALMMDVIIDFLDQYPDVSIEVDLSDRFVDVVEEGFDLAIRVGNLDDSSMFVRKILDVPMAVCCSKHYLEKHDMPKVPEDLAKASCILDVNRRNHNKWSFQKDGKEYSVDVDGRLKVNSAFAVRQAVMQGGDIGYTPLFAIKEDVQRGDVLTLLDPYQVDPLPIHAVYPHSRHLSAKVRLFVDFLVQKYKKTDPWG